MNDHERRPWHEVNGTAHDVALEVLLHGPISRSEIARRLHLSAASLTRLTKSLLESDLFVEGPTQIDPKSGRPTRPLDVVVDSQLFIGIRITEWEAQGVITTIRSEVVGRHTVRFEDTSPESVVRAVIDVVEELRSTEPLAGVGISIGGTVTERRIVTRAPFFGWRAPVAVADLVADRCGVPVVVANDVHALTQGQLWFGTGRSSDHFAIVTLGIATGLGLVVHGRVIESTKTGLGSVGHLPLEPMGPVCPDGHRGCAQAMLSIASVSTATTIALGRTVNYAAALKAARSGHLGAARVVRDSARALGRLVGIVASCTLADTILITGEGSGLTQGFEDSIDTGIEDITERASLTLRVEPQSSEPWSRGAATLAVEAYLLGTT